MAMSERCDHLPKLWGTLHDEDLMLKIGLVDFRWGGSECDFAPDEASRVASSLLGLARELLFREALFMMSFSCDLPGCFAGMVHDNSESRRKMMKWVRSVFQVLADGERMAQGDAWLRSFLQSLVWPCMSWAREMCVGVMETDPDADTLPSDIRDDILHMNSGPCSTKNIEDGFNVLRKAQKRSSNGSLSRQSRWYESLASPILEESDLKIPQKTAQDEVNG